jgi:hypothetical protein
MQGYELTCRSRVLPRARSISPKLVPWPSGAASGARRVLACEPARQTVLSISMNIHAIRPAVAEALTAPFLLMPLVVPESPLRLPHGGPAMESPRRGRTRHPRPARTYRWPSSRIDTSPARSSRDHLNSLVGRPRPLATATALGMPDDFEPHSPGLIAADTCMTLLRLDTLRAEAHWGIAAPLVRDSVTQQRAV